MLNILFRSDLSSVTGPTKVISNLIKGLQIIKYPFVLNGKISRDQFIYIPNSKKKLLQLLRLSCDPNRAVIGPNLFVLPSEIPLYMKPAVRKAKFYIQPCEWAKNIWEILGYKENTLKVWPTGIDTDYWMPFEGKGKKKILIYFKGRKDEELEYVKSTLEQLKLEYRVIVYGGYTETMFQGALYETSFIIWLGTHESQGIALQECLSSNIPIVVADVTTFSYPSAGALNELLADRTKYKVTAAPYFDERCGIVIENLGDLKEAVVTMNDTIGEFRPREYVIENLTLEKQAKALIDIFTTDK